MKSFRIFNRQTGSIIAVFAMVLAVVAPTIASAAQLTQRSVALSSSSINASGVIYNVSFTSVGAAGAVVVDFCDNSPLIGSTCNPPAGLVVSGTATSTFGTVAKIDDNTVAVTGTIAAATANISVPIAGITNPSTVGPIYARIVTYDTGAHAALYNSAQTASQDANRVDEGGAAISITNTIGVSAAVLESMLFCVSAAAINADCANVSTPTLKLGETTGSVIALSSSAISTGSLFTQISTNAATGAVVSLKSNATDCGGMIRAGAASSVCDIKPALVGGITAGAAKFGLMTETSTDSTGAGVTPSGIYQVDSGSGYSTSAYALNYAVGNTSGVTSPYGDPLLNTAGAPVNNKNIKLKFGASISNDTPAGLYSVDLGLIATGKF